MLKITALLLFLSQVCFAQTPGPGGGGNVTSVNGQTGVVVVGTPDAYTFYGDSTNGNDATCDGSFLKKCKTITKLLTFTTNPAKKYALRLSAGDFTGEPTIAWKPNVSVYGDSTTLNLDFTYTAASGDEANFVFDGVGVTSFTMDLTASSVGLPIFQNGSYGIIRTDATGGAHVITVRNAITGNLDLTGVAIFSNVLFVGSATVESGGRLLCTGCVWGISGDVYGTGTIDFQVSTFIGAVVGHVVGIDTPIVRLDASSNLGGTITIANTVYSDNANAMTYTPTTSANWNVVPATVAAALDNIASGELRPAAWTINGNLEVMGTTTLHFPIYDANGLLSVRSTARKLVDTSESTSIDWENRYLVDSDGAHTEDWQNRRLFDSGSVTSINWETKILKDSGDAFSLKWQDRILFDQASVNSADWQNRQLFDASGNAVVQWGITSLFDNLGNATVGWGERRLREVGGVATLDWGIQQLRDTSNNPSFDWQNRTLKDPSGNSTIEWSDANGAAKFVGVIIAANAVGTAAVQAAAGTGSSCTATGDDIKGQVSVTTGTIGISTGSYCNIPFGFGAYVTNKVCMLTPASATLSTSVYVSGPSPTGFSVNFAVAGGISQTYVENYHCL